VQIEPDWCGKLSRFALLFEALVKLGRHRARPGFLEPRPVQPAPHPAPARQVRGRLLFLRPHGMARNNSFVSTPRQRLEIDFQQVFAARDCGGPTTLHAMAQQSLYRIEGIGALPSAVSEVGNP
jgi:hypothetical protein